MRRGLKRSDRWGEVRVMLNAGKGYTKLISKLNEIVEFGPSRSRVESEKEREREWVGVIIPS